MQALLSQLPDDPSSIVITLKTETEAVSPTNGHKSSSNGPVYDPSMAYILELCTVLTLRDEETVNALGRDVAEALQNTLRNAGSYHHILISRTIFYLLQILQASYVSVINPRHKLNLTLTSLGTILHSYSGCTPYYIELQEGFIREVCNSRSSGSVTLH